MYSLSSVHFSRSVVSDSLQPHEPQHSRPPCPSPTPRVYSDSCPLCQWCHPTISSSVILSQHQGLFKWVRSSNQVAKILEFQLQHQSFQRKPRADLLQNGLFGSPCSPRDSQESSSTPQLKSINSSVLSFLYRGKIQEKYRCLRSQDSQPDCLVLPPTQPLPFSIRM